MLRQVHDEPETQPAVLLVWTDSLQDLQNLQAAAQDSQQKYSITIGNEFANNFWQSPAVSAVYELLPGNT